MKKAIKYITYFLIIGIIVSLGLCFIIIPDRTKCAMEVVVEWLNKPLGIIGGTTITLGLVAGIVIKLIYDRHKDSVKEIVEKGKSFVEEQKAQAKDYYELAIKEHEQTKEILSTYSTRIDDLLNKIVEVCNTIPNAKVKALGEQIKTNGDELKEELKAKVEESKNSFASAIDKKDTIKELEDSVARLTEQVERLLETHGEE